ncbi:MAG TPA: acyl carrier protein [Rhodopila sp.]
MAAPLYEITAILRGLLHDDDIELTPATRFEDITGWDSMDMINLIVELECRFDVQFALPEVDRLATVGDMLRMLQAKRILAAA